MSLMFGSLIAACMAFCCVRDSSAQSPPPSPSRIDTLRGQVEQADDNHASNEQLGLLWLQLGNEYETQAKLDLAEQAFDHALSFLRGSKAEAAYAGALDGLGAIYIATERTEAAEVLLEKALAIYDRLGNHSRAASVRQGIAISMLMAGRKRDGERASAEAIKEFEAASKPDIDGMSMALLTHSYALCLQGRCDAALADVDRAEASLRPVYAAVSLPMGSLWLVRGYDQWKSGMVDEGGRSMREALRIATSLDEHSEPLSPDLRRNALQQYAAFLKATHRKPEAREVEGQLAQLRSTMPSACRQCTVNVNALLPGSRR